MHGEYDLKFRRVECFYINNLNIISLKFIKTHCDVIHVLGLSVAPRAYGLIHPYSFVILIS
jgi:hypothetical protein